MLRQGDVLIIPTTAEQKLGRVVERERGRVILARGEATGHHHAIADDEVELRELPGTDDRFLRVMAAGGATLTHEEHAPVTIPRGDWLVRTQREYQGDDMPVVGVRD